MPPIPPFSQTQLQAICDIVGDTSDGLTGSEIGKLLALCNIEDPYPNSTKRHRLYDALSRRQSRDRCANKVMAFIFLVMDPVRWVGRQDKFEYMRHQLNQVLSFAGYALGEDGKARYVTPVKTLSEAEERARRLKHDMEVRGVHPDVLRFCRAELLQENYFHAVFEATKSVADKLRQLTGLTSDGAELVDHALGLGKSGVPMLAFNRLQTETERSEHIGLMNLFKGMFGTFRNTTAHAPKIAWQIDEQDARDLLSIASLLHRRLDGATRAAKGTP